MEATLDLTAMMEMIVVRSACILLMYITAAMPFSEACREPVELGAQCSLVRSEVASGQ